MGGCPPPFPPVTRPRRRLAPGGGAPRPGRAAVRGLRARAVLHGALRLLRLQHLHRRGARRRAPAPRGRRTPRRRSPRSARPAGCWATWTCRSRRSSSAGVRRPCCRRATWPRSWPRCRAEFGLAEGVEVTTESNPDSVTLCGPRGAARGRLHPDLVRHAVGGPARAGHPGPHRTTRCRVPAVVEWARAAGFEQVSLDLIYGTPGESLADWETSLDVGAGLRARPRLGVRADRRGRHRAGPAGAPRRGRDARRRRPRRQVPRRRRALSAAGLGWYEVSNWATRAGRAVPPQPRLLDRRRLVGRRPRRALARRRRALVERQAPGGLRRADRGRGQPRARPRDARRGDPPGGAGAARGAAARRAAARRPRRRPGAPPCPAWWTTGCVTAEDGPLVLTRRGRLLADAVVRALLP